MTIGPAILLVPFLEPERGEAARVEPGRGALARFLEVFGCVPFFYYALHVVLIHAIFVGLSLVRFGEVIPWMAANHPMRAGPPPPGYAYGLGALYAITALVVALLYFPCRWFAGVKRRNGSRWLSFV